MRNKKDYRPQPIDTSNIELPQELQDLGEELAKNVHEVWSYGRIKEGWSYGNVCDDVEKKHPCLVPYEELSEEEKEYDRNTANSTLKLIIKLGFNITSK